MSRELGDLEMGMAANGRWLDGTILALLLAASVLLHAGIVAKPSEPQPGTNRALAVLFAPWTDAGEAMRRVADSGARIVRFGAVPFIVIAEPDRPDFASRVAQRGALITLDPRVLAACLPAGAI
jgi:hypothetical protein